MSEEKIWIEIIGEDAEAAADALSEIIRAEFGTRPERFTHNEGSARGEPGTKWDPALIGAAASLTAAVLAIPAALLAALEIKDRLDKKRRFERLLEQGENLKKVKRITTIRFRIGKMEWEIEKASFAELSDKTDSHPSKT